MESSWDPRAPWKLWFEILSKAMDGHMRSVAFLRLMQHGLGTTGSRTGAEPAAPKTLEPPDPS